eukprot:5190755-Amphidinium_carterae.1
MCAPAVALVNGAACGQVYERTVNRQSGLEPEHGLSASSVSFPSKLLQSVVLLQYCDQEVLEFQKTR